MVETFAEHLDLDDAIERAVAQGREDRVLLVLPLFAVDDLRGETTFAVERADLPGVVDGASDGDELMLRAGLPQLFKLCEAGVDDVLIAQRARARPRG